MYLKPALSRIIIFIKRYMVQCYYTLIVLNLLDVILCKDLSALARDGEMPINAKIPGGFLKKPPVPMPQSVSSGEGSTSAGPLCSPFISAPSPLAASGGEPSVSRSGTLALAPKTKGGQDKVGE